ncbi:hypothetical protein [Desulfatiglans anilini]|nr:hypothetical protein [Desulfatiglans anilini]
MQIDETKYKSDLGIEPYSKERVEAALEHVDDIRKFEIELRQSGSVRQRR